MIFNFTKKTFDPRVTLSVGGGLFGTDSSTDSADTDGGQGSEQENERAGKSPLGKSYKTELES